MKKHFYQFTTKKNAVRFVTLINQNNSIFHLRATDPTYSIMPSDGFKYNVNVHGAREAHMNYAFGIWMGLEGQIKRIEKESK